MQVTNLSRDWARAVLDIPVPNGADITRVNAVLQQVGIGRVRRPELQPLLLDTPP